MKTLKLNRPALVIHHTAMIAAMHNRARNERRVRLQRMTRDIIWTTRDGTPYAWVGANPQ